MKLFKDDAKFVAQDRLRLRNSLRESVSSLHHMCMYVFACTSSESVCSFVRLLRVSGIFNTVIAMIALARKYRRMCESRFKNEITRQRVWKKID